ncbi:chaperonin groEL [Aeromonas phage D3]|uniref:Putative chaperonin GroEL n=1 Tax=Aeromonas phage D3 TaxID=2593327 RepID=A0A514TV83_9CAUD|nr:chaperonin groEL [Aeromonas phage D3]QDJ96938.1 putative chaperonin GroEL [Aeromonas phage D3]QEP52244.1 chaperonin [Aeromonas phage D9]
MSILNDVTYTNRAGTREIIDEVVQEAFDSVCSTMGPDGNYVVINQSNVPVTTKDGASVAKALDFGETRRNMIAQLVREPSLRVEREVGDGTTTTVFMTTKLYQAFCDNMTFREIRFIDSMVGKALEALRKLIIPVKASSPEFKLMLTTTANYETEIVERILELYQGDALPNITLRKNPSIPEDRVERVTDLRYNGAYPSPEIQAMSKAPRSRITFGAGTTVVVVDSNIETIQMGDLARLAQPGGDPVVIIATSFSMAAIQAIKGYYQMANEEALKALQADKSANVALTAPIVPFTVQAGGTLGKAMLLEMAQLLGLTTAVDLSNGITLAKECDAPFVLSQDGVTIPRECEHVETRRKEMLEINTAQYEELDQATRQKAPGLMLFERIGILSGTNITVSVTGQTESDCSERYYRYEDVITAARSSLGFGVLPGIGWGYLQAAKEVEDHFYEVGITQNQRILMDKFLDVLRAQYTYLTGNVYRDMDRVSFLDLTTGEESKDPGKVYDNAAATCLALESGWGAAKTLGKLSTITGRGDTNYLHKR